MDKIMKSTEISQDSMSSNCCIDLEPFKAEMEVHQDIGKTLIEEKNKGRKGDERH